jgi:hypothetical protein
MKALLASSALALAMFAAPSAMAQQDAPFCLQGSDSGVLNCAYQTMAQCEAAKRGTSNTETCMQNPRGTVGSGGTSGSGMGSGGAGSGEGSPSPNPAR